MMPKHPDINKKNNTMETTALHNMGAHLEFQN